jgi:hypothetical protein
MHDQQKLNEYFSSKWDTNAIHKFIYSGTALAKKISLDEYVLDVGCGANLFKPLIPNLTGIDPTNMGADIVTTIEDFIPDRLYDVAFCLGSINFGTDDIIAKQIDKVVSCLAESSRVYWRLNPGVHDHAHDDFKEIEVYPWTLEKLWEHAKKHGYCQVNCAHDSTSDGNNRRLYAEWIR